MGFMRPRAEKMVVMYLIETNSHTEMVPENVCGSLDVDWDADQQLSEDDQKRLLEYCEGSRIIGDVERVEGWFSYLHAPGYLDMTGYLGPFQSGEEALNTVMTEYEVDENGDPWTDDAPDTEREPEPIPREVQLIGDCSAEALDTMRHRGGTWYAYENMDLSSATCGSYQFLQCGPSCTHKLPPKNAPDGPAGFGWRYQFAGQVDLETGKVIR